jgi:small multidrug resistance family-3 protein
MNVTHMNEAPMNLAERWLSSGAGALAVLALAAFLEAYADSFFQIGIHRSMGTGRATALMAGVGVMAAYGLLVNTPRWDFGRLIGVYVVFFFLMAQLLNRVRFGQSPGAPIYAGGALIVAGGLVIAFWRG